MSENKVQEGKKGLS